ncbi:MAG: murB [Ilumatobacteraceae bacterium]|nr:murB [Ilumatobacteraceae bacterium]
MAPFHGDSSFGDRIDQAARDLAPFASRDVALAPLTTYRLGGPAALAARPRSLDDLDALAKTLSITGLPVLVVGGGSNLLVADDGFAGIAVVVADLALLDGTGPGQHHTDGTQVVANAAAPLPRLARRLVAESLTGFEWAVGVPGSVGGAVRMNAGGHGSDMAACLVEARLFDLSTGRCAWVPVGRLGLRFRGSDLAAHQLVLEARVALAAGERDRSQRELDEVVRWRRERQPGGQNAGSVFVNPIPGELTAGELIDRVGLRGHVFGTASVSEKHANFIQGSEGGRSADVRALIELVRDRVAAETGFVLRSEVRLVGFADVPDDESPGVPV